jgi:hypothetical protein
LRSRALLTLLLILPWSRPSAAAVDVTNVGVDVSLGFEIQGDYVAMRSSEARSGATDLNGDGDTLDFVLQVYDASTGMVRNTGYEASGGFRMADRYIAFSVLESRQGSTDLNGDGDTSDLVQFLFDAQTGAVTNLGLATTAFRIDGNVLAFTVNEAAQGGADLNGDGDAKDSVLFLYNLTTHALTNVGLDAAGGFVLDSNRVAFAVSESNQGMADLNGDGDAVDNVLHVVDAATGVVTNLHRATLANQFQLDSNLLAFVVRENLQGNTNLNGDADVNDNVLHLYDASTATLTNLGRAVSSFQLADGIVAFAQSETAQGGIDQNGDGDSLDDVLEYYDSSNASFHNLGFAVEGFQVDALHIAFGVREFRQGSTDLNGDGDTADLVIHLYDFALGTTVNLGTDATLGFKLDGDMLLAFGTSEAAQGGSDLNNDGDAADFSLHLYDIVTGTVVNLHVDPSGGFQTFQLDGRFLTFGVRELAQGATDLNGDGDTGDVVLHDYDADTGVTTNFGFDVTAGHQIDSGRIAFAVTENNQGMTDLNGDGDATDVVLFVADLEPETSRALLQALVAQVQSLGLPRGIERTETALLNEALKALDRDDTCKAISWLQAFKLSLKNEGKKLSSADRKALRDAADALIAALTAEAGSGNSCCHGQGPGHGHAHSHRHQKCHQQAHDGHGHAPHKLCKHAASP